MTSPNDAQALREFFKHERDEELGRWRWPENPDYVVMDRGVGFVAILHEPTMGTTTWERSWRDARSTPDEAGLAYFDAHPERKPWHEAKPGEVWALTTNQHAEEWAAKVSTDQEGVLIFELILSEMKFRIDDELFISGRKIWPEDAS
ncbi:hypothetical protein LVJ59_17650 [Microbacterium sp. KKR3/1]|uniref:hypothetical protein n=1 Tax=Microbacterium sp. KKR3/1 TaxID=2904241 RepID=UPI001E62FD1D|nr:hypothetical protein [Microbacterium sp. KKR3/1]MCE0510875.1 hypothetical protein [Microbacterium sp. KKR3/1]